MDAWRKAGATSSGREGGRGAAGGNANLVPLGRGGGVRGIKRSLPPEDVLDSVLYPAHALPKRAELLTRLGVESKGALLALPAPSEEPYRLVAEPPAPRPAPDTSTALWGNDTLPGRALAGPARPNETLGTSEHSSDADFKVPLSQAEKSKLQQLAKDFGFGGDTLANQYEVSKRTNGFRKLYCGALSSITTEKMLEEYFSKYSCT